MGTHKTKREGGSACYLLCTSTKVLPASAHLRAQDEKLAGRVSRSGNMPARAQTNKRPYRERGRPRRHGVHFGAPPNDPTA